MTGDKGNIGDEIVIFVASMNPTISYENTFPTWEIIYPYKQLNIWITNTSENSHMRIRGVTNTTSCRDKLSKPMWVEPQQKRFHTIIIVEHEIEIAK